MLSLVDLGARIKIVIAVLTVVITACGGTGGATETTTIPDGTTSTTEHPPPPPPPELTEPIGEPMLPDLVPEPPVSLRLNFEEDTTILRFSSTLANVGEGDFVLRGERPQDEWIISQELWYSESGADLVQTDAEVVWGGDGHNHWHIRRVANYWLVPLDEDGKPVEDAPELPDNKVGFCFYDHSRILETGPEEWVFRPGGCGEEDATEIRMGMSIGWADVYDFGLPGQDIDITSVEDGSYRIWAQADSQGWFTEADTDNNVTWVDFELVTRDGTRFAEVFDVGPSPSDE